MLEVARRPGDTSSGFTMDRYGHLFAEADDALSACLAGLSKAPAPAAEAPVVERRGA